MRHLALRFPIYDEWSPHRHMNITKAGPELDSCGDGYVMAAEMVGNAREEVGAMRRCGVPLWALRCHRPVAAR